MFTHSFIQSSVLNAFLVLGSVLILKIKVIFWDFLSPMMIYMLLVEYILTYKQRFIFADTGFLYIGSKYDSTESLERILSIWKSWNTTKIGSIKLKSPEIQEALKIIEDNPGVVSSVNPPIQILNQWYLEKMFSDPQGCNTMFIHNTYLKFITTESLSLWNAVF